MLMPFGGDVGNPQRASGLARLPRIAKDEAPPDVEVPVEPEALVQWASFGGVGPAEREQIALDRVDVACGRVLEGPQVGRADTPSARDGDGGVIERSRERRDDVPGGFDAGVHQHDDGRGGAPYPDIGGGPLPEPLGRPYDFQIAPDEAIEPRRGSI